MTADRWDGGRGHADDTWAGWDDPAPASSPGPHGGGDWWAEAPWSGPPAGDPPAGRGGGGRLTLVTVLVGVVAVLVGAVVYLAVDRGGAPDGEGSGLAAATSSAPAATDGTGSTDAAGSTGAAEASSSNAPSSGSYTGTLQQRGTSSTRQDRDYAVEMTFSSGGSSVRYPGLGCAGTLVPRGDSGVDRIYREEIHTGRCDDGGTWTVTRVGDGRLDVNYEAPTGRYVVTGTLTR